MNETKYSRLNDWVELGMNPSVDHGEYLFLRLPDYVFTICVGVNQMVPLVTQFRIPQNRETLELPAGLIEKGETPLDSGIREAREETGLVNFESKSILGPFTLDTGRIENNTFLVILEGCTFDENFQGENGVKVSFHKIDELISKSYSGEISHLGQIATILLSRDLGLLKFSTERS